MAVCAATWGRSKRSSARPARRRDCNTMSHLHRSDTTCLLQRVCNAVQHVARGMCCIIVQQRTTSCSINGVTALGVLTLRQRKHAAIRYRTTLCRCEKTHCCNLTDPRVHTQRRARARWERLSDALERSHLCSDVPGITNLLLPERRAHLNGSDHLSASEARVPRSRHTGRWPPSAPALCAP